MEKSKKNWSLFVQKQKEEILKRHNKKYNNLKIVKEQLKETGELSLYQRYKIDTVSKYQRRCLEKIEEGTYGICDVCEKKISIKRLELVPAALTCVSCDHKKEA